MKEIKLICDYCGKSESLPYELAPLPREWLALAYHKGSFTCYDDWRITHYFCSRDCMDKAMKGLSSP